VVTKAEPRKPCSRTSSLFCFPYYILAFFQIGYFWKDLAKISEKVILREICKEVCYHSNHLTEYVDKRTKSTTHKQWYWDGLELSYWVAASKTNLLISILKQNIINMQFILRETLIFNMLVQNIVNTQKRLQTDIVLWTVSLLCVWCSKALVSIVHMLWCQVCLLIPYKVFWYFIFSIWNDCEKGNSISNHGEHCYYTNIALTKWLTIYLFIKVISFLLVKIFGAFVWLSSKRGAIFYLNQSMRNASCKVTKVHTKFRFKIARLEANYHKQIMLQIKHCTKTHF